MNIPDVVYSPVETVKDDGGGAGSAREDLDTDDVGLLRNTISLASNRSSHVSSVSDSVGAASTDSIVSESSAALKLRVGSQDTSVDDV